ncbi:MAG TPA: hypothetical protein VFH04_02880 [Nitrososphaeraceae archaeon]|jgi:hypothetical protein|nr:hypothetical protein [Nitrososphaeraceae archaeon]
MTWFRDPYGHIIESRNKTHRLVYCSLCQKLASKSDCIRLRLSNRNGRLYEIKSYKYDKPSKVRRLQKGVVNKLQQANPNQELTKMIGDVI